MTSRLTTIGEQIGQLEISNNKAESLKVQQIEQLDKLKDRITKLASIAKQYGVSEQTKIQNQELQEQIDQLSK